MSAAVHTVIARNPTVTPLTLGAYYWRRPDLLAAGAVASYAPKAGAGTIIQVTPANRPENALANPLFGNKPTISFLDANDALSVASTYVVPLPPFTVMYVGRRTGASTYLGGQLSAVSGRYFRLDTTRIRYEEGTTTTSDALISNIPGAYGMSVDLSRTVKFWNNGLQLGVDQTHAAFTASGAAGTYYAGNPVAPGWIGEEAEFASWNRVLTAAEQLSYWADYVAPYYML